MQRKTQEASVSAKMFKPLSLFLSYFSSEYMSSRLFWMGVPVTAQRAPALSRHTAMEVCTFGFLMLWASSRTTRAQFTRRRGAECGDWWKQHGIKYTCQLRLYSYHIVRHKINNINNSHHILSVFGGFLSLLLLDWDLFRDQTVCRHHHIIICQPEGWQNVSFKNGSFIPTSAVWV